MLIDFEGMEIDWFPRDGTEEPLRMIAVELSTLLRKLRMTRIDDQEEVNEVSLRFGSVTTLAKIIGGEYMLVLSLGESGDVSRGQTMLRLIAPYVEKELL
jgi:hypothetical protein